MAPAEDEDTPVVFLHGLFEGPALWHDLRRRLARHRGGAHIALPLPGHRHDAPDHRETGAILREEGLAEHLAARIDARFGGRSVRLVGHSLGGLLALLIARQRPGLVADIMVIGAPHAGHTGHHAWFDPRMLADIPLVSHASARILLPFWLADARRFEHWMQAAIAGGESIVRLPPAMRRELQSGCPRAMHAMAVWLRGLRGDDTRDLLADVACPVTIMICAEDPVVAPAHQMALVSALPDAVARIVRCGHLPMLTAPDRFERAVLDWLAVGAARERAYSVPSSESAAHA